MTLPALALAVTLAWTMPATNAHGDTLTGYLRWEAAVTVQSPTWQAHGDSCASDTALWARVVREADWRVLSRGYALAGAAVTAPAPPVMSLETFCGWWVRACRDSCGAWSRAVGKP